MNVANSRSGFFDRWKVTGTNSRLFRRGKPFVDGIETLLNLDDRGQAVAMWRLNQRWPHEPLVVFGFDFVVEAALDPIVNTMAGITGMRSRSGGVVRIRRSRLSTSAFGFQLTLRHRCSIRLSPSSLANR